MRDSGKDSQKRTEIVRDLDGILPEDVDRRKFLTATVGTVGTGLLAGCMGGGGGNTPTDGSGSNGSGNQGLIKNVNWRQPWKRTMSWAAAFIAQYNGFFTDFNVSSPNIEPGFGSPDTARRVGTGKAQVGHADSGSTLAGLAQGQKFTIAGASRQRTILGLTWRTDLIDGPKDIEGENVVLATPFAKATWPVVPQVLGVDGSKVETTYVKGGVEVGQISQGKAVAVWGGMNGQTAIYQQMGQDASLNTRAFNTFSDVIGYMWFVNNDWLANESNSVEYLSRLLSGYSKAVKWTVVNPEETIKIMVEDINPSLAANTDRVLRDRMKVNIGINLHGFIKGGGGFLDYEDAMMQQAFDVFGQALVENPDDVPAVDKVVDRRALDKAELATLSSDEWNKATEWAQPIWGWFEK